MRKIWHRPKRSIQFQLTLCFLGIMLVMFLMMQFVFRNAVGYTRQTLMEKNRQTAYQLETQIKKEISTLQTMQLSWLLDQDAIQSFSCGRTPDLIDLYHISFQMQRRMKLIWYGSNIDGLHFYVANSEYLLTLVTPSSQHAERIERIHRLMDMYTAHKSESVICYDGQLFLVNPYLQDATAYRRQFSVALVFELSTDNWFRMLPTDCVAWIEGEDDDFFISHALTANDVAGISQSAQEGETLVWLDGERYVVTAFSLADNTLTMYVLKRLDEGGIASIQRSFYTTFALCCVALCLLFAYLLRRLISKPLSRLAGAFREVECGNYPCAIPETGAEEMRLINASFNHMSSTLHYLIEHKYVERMLANEAELKLLQSQINPHFLYNSFFLMNSLIEMKDYDHLETLTQNLGQYFQYMFLNADGFKTLEQEMSHARAYADIQQMRFINRVIIAMDPIPERWKGARIPAMSVQPLIENAFRHGFGKTERHGCLRIRMEEGDGILRVAVSNTGVSVTNEELSALRYRLLRSDGQEAKTALTNIHRRMRIFYGDSYGLHLDNMEGVGFEVSFLVPKEG